MFHTYFLVLNILLLHPQAERAELITQVRALKDDNRQFKSIVEEKIKEIEPLNQALGKFRNANNPGRNGGLCSSEEELNATVSFDRSS